MTIKLLVLKSGEDIIADVNEMVVGEEEEKRVVGYFLDKPCVVKIINSQVVEEEAQKQNSFNVSLYPWVPLSADNIIPVPSDWLITMVEPAYKLKEMYVKDIVKNGNQSDSTDDNSADTDKSD